jgi:hypothetical protein
MASLNLGLILGSALAGAAAGGGEAAEKMGASMQDAQQKQDLVRLQSQLDEQKQMRIQEAEHNFQNQFQQQGFAHADQTLDKTQQFQAGQTDKTLASEEKRSAANNATSLAVANISAGSAQTVEAMRVAAQKEISAQSAKGFQIIQDKDGGFMTVDKVNGTTTPLLVNGQQVIGAKNVDSATALAAAALLKADPTADPATQQANQEKAYKLLGIDPARVGKTGPVPSAKAIAALKSNPSTKAQFDATFGQGAADSILNGGTPASGKTANPFNGGGTTAPPPGGGDPGAGTNNPPLINGNIPTQPAPAVQGVPVNNAQFAQGGSRLPAPPAAPAAPAPAAPAPYQPSALIASAMTPQQGPPPTQPQFRQQLDAFGRPIPQGGVQNPLGL